MEANGKGILLLERHEGLQRIMTLILKQAGFQVTQVSSIDNLLETLDTISDDNGEQILIIDISGIDKIYDRVFRQLQDSKPGLPIIFISPYGEESTGPDEDILLKHPLLTTPFSPEELLDCIKGFSNSDKKLSHRSQ